MLRIIIFSAMIFLSTQSIASELKTNWFEFFPYSFKNGENLSGIDIEISNAIIKYSGYSTSREEKPWHESLTMLKEGKIDFLTSATYTEERANFAYFSLPYRYESNALVMLKHPRIILNFKTTSGLIEDIKNRGLKLGTIKGYAYSDIGIANYIKNNATTRRNTSKELVKDIIDGKIDGFITDSNEARKISSTSNGTISYIETGMKTPIRLMFSKKNIEKSFVDKSNKSIEKVLKSGLYEQIVKKYSK